MTKTGWLILYIVVAAAIGICAALIKQKHKDKEKEVFRLFCFAELLVLVYCISFLTDHIPVLQFVNSAAIYLEGYFSYCFLRYVIGFTSFERQEKRIYRNLVLGFYLVDFVMFALNYWTQAVFHYQVLEIRGGNYLRIEPRVWLYVHLLVCNFLAVISFWYMIRKMCSVPQLYKMRYIAIPAAFLIVAIANDIYIFVDYPIDFSIFMYVLLGASIYFYTYHYMEYTSQRNLKNYVINNLSCPVLLFDYDDVLQVYNSMAVEELDIEPHMNLFDFAERNHLKYLLSREAREAGRTKVFSMADYRKRIYMVQGNELEENGKFFGTLILYNDITSTETFKNELAYHATHDHLTGLWNREFFFETASQVLAEHPDRDFMLMVTDIYQFRMFNEILGKKLGDDLLVTIANTLQEHHTDLRVEGRTHGDRFAILIPKEEFHKQELMDICHQVVEQKNYALKIHLYFGAYDIKDRSLGVEKMYDRAYMALDTIKGNPQKKIAVFEESMRDRLVKNMLTIDELEEALQEKQFMIYIQPQIDSKTGNWVGGEALVRWKSPRRGIVPPFEFIPLFEENGMIIKLDYYVWDMTCQQLRKWKDQGLTDCSLSINISAKDFYLTDLYTDIVGLVEKYEIDPACLKLEITETAIMVNVQEQMVLIKKLQDYGFLIEMDDFGSGYSSLNSLKDIAVDILKLDMKFFEKSENPERSEKIVDSIINLSRNLKMPVIAEGVEDDEQLNLLKRLGCRIVQGYYYSKPIPLPEFEQFIEGRGYTDIKEFIRELNYTRERN